MVCRHASFFFDTNDSGYNTALALVIISQSVIIRASEWSGAFFVRGMAMKVKDLEELSYICSVYSMCYCMNEFLYGMYAEDFPDELHECIDNLKTNITHTVKCIENYRDHSGKKFLSQCEDYKQL